MTKIKKDDFVELDYTGKLTETGEIFDTTSEDVAHEHGIPHHHGHMHAVVAKVGLRIVLPGLDDALVGKEVGDKPNKFSITLEPEQAFGKKDPKLMQLIATNKFTKQNIKPAPGMQVTIDEHRGIIRSVTGGRTVVDFNHPLAGKQVTYDVSINKIVSDKKRQAEAAFSWMGLRPKEFEVKGDQCVIKAEKPLEPNMSKAITEQLKKFTGLTLTFELSKKESKDDKADKK